MQYCIVTGILHFEGSPIALQLTVIIIADESVILSIDEWNKKKFDSKMTVQNMHKDIQY